MNKIETTQGTSPLLLEMPHSGRMGMGRTAELIPDLQRSNLRTSKAVRRTIGFGRDAAVPQMTNFNALVGTRNVSGLKNNFARALTDPNRASEEISGLALEGMDPKKYNGGVLMAQTVPMEMEADFSDLGAMEAEARSKFEPMYQRPFTEQELEEILRRIYHPYHRAIQDHHDRIRTKHGFAAHLALHSLPAANVASVDGGYVLGGRAARGELDLTKGVLPDVILIHNGFQAASPDLVQGIRHTFEEAGLIVSDGVGPFTGSNGVTGMYGRPDEGVHVIGIEHVTHQIEPDRHLGGTKVDGDEAKKNAPHLQKTCRKFAERILITKHWAQDAFHDGPLPSLPPEPLHLARKDAGTALPLSPGHVG